MKSKKYFPALLLLFSCLLIALLSACGNGGSQGGDIAGDGEYLLTVDGYGVTEEEFRLFLGDQRAVTANYFWTQYQVQPDADFWVTAVNGETPDEYAKQRALDALIRSKVEFILASERDILEYLNYDGLMADMEAENADRAQKRETGEVYYGLNEFTPFTYYHYLNNNLRSELEYAQRDPAKPTDAELRSVYEENKESFTLGTVYSYTITYPDGTGETVNQNNLEVGKADETTEVLLWQFDSMIPDSSIDDFDYRGETVKITYLSKTHQGYASFEEVRDSLVALYAREALSKLIDSRVEAAQVKFDQARFDAIEMQ